MKKRIAVLALAALMAASFSTAALAAPAPAPGLSPFVDLSADHWSYPYVYELYTQLSLIHI